MLHRKYPRVGKINKGWGVEENEEDHLDGIRREEDNYWKICKTPDRIFFIQQQIVMKNRNSRILISERG